MTEKIKEMTELCNLFSREIVELFLTEMKEEELITNKPYPHRQELEEYLTKRKYWELLQIER